MFGKLKQLLKQEYNITNVQEVNTDIVLEDQDFNTLWSNLGYDAGIFVSEDESELHISTDVATLGSYKAYGQIEVIHRSKRKGDYVFDYTLKIEDENKNTVVIYPKTRPFV